ncbi:unnamed protein product [Jaminaea pallidilutea]
MDTIYIARHGFRMAWQGNQLGLSPTGRPRDPVLTAHGIDQVKLLAQHFASLPEDQRPQMIVSSPYYRCVQTAGPSAQTLDMDIHVEPGITEWFPPVTSNTGYHPVPMRASTISQYAPRVASSEQWSPLVYPHRRGESIQDLHTRARRVLERIVQRCEQRGVRRVLLVSHAATVIAMGRAMVEAEAEQMTDWSTGRGIEVGAGTASLSLYVRGEAAEKRGLATEAAKSPTGWVQALNGSAEHLPDGVEREWTFKDIAGNVEEPGMGVGHVDEEAFEEAEMQRLEQAGVVADQDAASVWGAGMASRSGPGQESAKPRF